MRTPAAVGRVKTICVSALRLPSDEPVTQTVAQAVKAAELTAAELNDWGVALLERGQEEKALENWAVRSSPPAIE